MKFVVVRDLAMLLMVAQLLMTVRERETQL
jgi:hypothetical protein